VREIRREIKKLAQWPDGEWDGIWVVRGWNFIGRMSGINCKALLHFGIVSR